MITHNDCLLYVFYKIGVILEPTHPLEDRLGFVVNVVGRLMKRALFLKLADTGVTPTQWTVLMCLWDTDGLSFTELGKRLSFDHPTVTGVVDRMEREKLVKRKRDHLDRRVVKVFLTPKGKDLEVLTADAGIQVDKVATDGLGNEQVEQLKQWIQHCESKLKEEIGTTVQNHIDSHNE
jgi:DNA-binding MarR family transcriptional regulator